jgi:hypothetical protein
MIESTSAPSLPPPPPQIQSNVLAPIKTLYKTTPQAIEKMLVRFKALHEIFYFCAKHIPNSS